MPEISVIIPIYNAEKYLDSCIQSVADQTFADFECILVNDCSTDGSAEICDEIAKKDSRFFVIHKLQNEGNLKTRKRGLDEAKGEFIVFVDNDDRLELNALQLFIEKQKETNADIVIAGFCLLFSDDFAINYRFPKISDNLSPFEYFFYTKCRTLWGKLFRKELFEGIIIAPRSVSIGDDAIYNTQIFSKLSSISQIAIVDSIVYNWDGRNPNSITGSTGYSYKSFLDDPRIGCRIWIEDYLKSVNVDEKAYDAFRFYMIEEGICPFFLHNKLLQKKDVKLLYSKYFTPFSRKSMLNILDRISIEIFNISIFGGRFFHFVRSIASRTLVFIRKMKF